MNTIGSHLILTPLAPTDGNSRLQHPLKSLQKVHRLYNSFFVLKHLHRIAEHWDHAKWVRFIKLGYVFVKKMVLQSCQSKKKLVDNP